jgi:hypothetical protein
MRTGPGMVTHTYNSNYIGRLQFEARPGQKVNDTLSQKNKLVL